MSQTGVLLANLGTPESPSTADVRKYLFEFLNDPFVMDMPWLKRWMLVNLLIVPFRASKTAGLYEQIWTDNGSPMLRNSADLTEKLQFALGDKYMVALGMRYQQPSLKKALEKLRAASVSKIIALPLYPQYTGSTTGSTIQKLKNIAGADNGYPPIKFIKQFYNHSAFIDAWADVAKKYTVDAYGHVLFSFHGLPERHLKKGHGGGSCTQYQCVKHVNSNNPYCYLATCHDTARQIARKLNLSEKRYTVCFQSRLGKEPWIKPYTNHVLVEKARSGTKNMLVFSPSFVADCLETLYEIGIEYKRLFRENGGETLQLVESLNAHPSWVAALSNIISDRILSDIEEPQHQFK